MVENADKIEFAEALFDNESEWPGELEFRKGEILKIVDKKLNSPADGWWVCADNRGSRGIVPANRLKIVNKTDLSSSFENRCFPFFDHDLEFPPVDDTINIEIPRLLDFGDRFRSMNKNNDTNGCIGKGSPVRRIMDFPDHDRLLSEFKNFRLLHGIDRPYKTYNSDDVSASYINETFYSIPKKNSVTVRNVPITIEKQNRAGESSPSFSTLPPFSSESRVTNTETNDAITTRNGSNRPKSPPAPPTRRHVIYNADGVDNPFLGSLKGRQNGFCDVASSSGYGENSDTYDLLPRRTSPIVATLSRPRKPVNDLQQQLPHRVRFAADYDANNVAHYDPSAVGGFVARQVSSSDADDRSSSITLTSNSADSSFSNGSSTTTNDALLQAKSDNLYDVPRLMPTANNRYDVSRTGKDENVHMSNDAKQKFHSLVDNSLIASIYDAPLATIQFPVPSTSTKTQLQKSQQNRKSPFDDYDFVDAIAKNGTKSCEKTTSIDDDNNLYQEKLEILSFYVPQVDSQMESLNRAIDDFLSSVESNSPPRDFVAKSRFVVLSAHKLVYLGDSLSHCLKNDERDRSSIDKLSSSCDRLCDALKSCVASTKRACSTFPCVEDVQTMVDRMVRISNDAHEFKLSVAHLARR